MQLRFHASIMLTKSLIGTRSWDDAFAFAFAFAFGRCSLCHPQWSDKTNTKQRGIDWPVTFENARTKLTKLYPKIKA
jgi:hypothetical protein